MLSPQFLKQQTEAAQHGQARLDELFDEEGQRRQQPAVSESTRRSVATVTDQLKMGSLTMPQLCAYAKNWQEEVEGEEFSLSLYDFLEDGDKDEVDVEE